MCILKPTIFSRQTRLLEPKEARGVQFDFISYSWLNWSKAWKKWIIVSELFRPIRLLSLLISRVRKKWFLFSRPKTIFGLKVSGYWGASVFHSHDNNNSVAIVGENSVLRLIQSIKVWYILVLISIQMVQFECGKLWLKNLKLFLRMPLFPFG